MLLPEANVKILLNMIDEMLKQKENQQNIEVDTEENKKERIKRKMSAVQSIIEMRNKSPFPADFNYDEVLEEAITKKYGRFN